ncbi:MAG: SDR family oxidoreductase [Phenylobacterium sp.]|nr:MAG: SDR family oxidoreductase [Phenylobacterium sp.]
MRVFVTGATGFIGSAVVPELIAAGHQVLGLARSDANAEALTRAGAEVHRGELTDLDSLAAAARACDGVIHLAFIHDFSQYMQNNAIDLAAVKAMTGVLEGTGKPFVGTSGTLMVAERGRAATEDDAPLDLTGPRAAAEQAVLEASGRGVRGSFVRLSPTVHGEGDGGFIKLIVGAAKRTGVAAYVGEGASRWPAVHRLDAARLFRLAVEKAPAGSRLHGAAEEGVTQRAIAETIGAGLGLPVRSIAPEEAMAQFEFLGMFIARDDPTSSAITRETLGWTPTGPDLLTDIRDHYLA